VLLCVAVGCSVAYKLHYMTCYMVHVVWGVLFVCCSVLQCVAVVAVCCSALQCVAESCSALQCGVGSVAYRACRIACYAGRGLALQHTA